MGEFKASIYAVVFYVVLLLGEYQSWEILRAPFWTVKNVTIPERPYFAQKDCF